MGSVLLTLPETNYNFSSIFCLTISHCLSFLTDRCPFNPWAISWFVLHHNHTPNSHLQDPTRLFPGCTDYQFHIPLISLVSKHRNLTPLLSRARILTIFPEPHSLTFLFPKLPLPDKLFSLHRCISLQFLQKYLYDTEVYNFIKETVRHV